MIGPSTSLLSTLIHLRIHEIRISRRERSPRRLIQLRPPRRSAHHTTRRLLSLPRSLPHRVSKILRRLLRTRSHLPPRLARSHIPSLRSAHLFPALAYKTT